MFFSQTVFDARLARRVAAAALSLLFTAMPAWGQCPPQELVALGYSSNATAGDEFGFSVAMSDDTIVFGAPGDSNAGGIHGGSAYVFVSGGADGVWNEQQAILTASDGDADDHFGRSVAISGDTILVGACHDDHAGIDAGAAYVFTRSDGTWTQQAKLIASDAAAGAAFGCSVALSGDTAVIGSRDAAYVFVRTGTDWTEQARLGDPDPTGQDNFGQSVALSGEMLVVGACTASAADGFASGSAFVFVRTGTEWVKQAKLSASDGMSGDEFGYSVAISGDTVVVGAFLDDFASKTTNEGSAYVFTRAGPGASEWSEQAKLTASDPAADDMFGIGVAVSGDTLLIGASGGEAAYVFSRNADTWTEHAKLIASDATWGDEFGCSVGVSGDTAMVGAHLHDFPNAANAGSGYVFDLGLSPSADMDLDGDVDSLDVYYFIYALQGLADPIHTFLADMNCSGTTDGLDIQPFVELLLNN